MAEYDETSQAFRGELQVAGDFPEPDIETWRNEAERTLKGRKLSTLDTTTHEGLVVRPLYTRDDLPAPPGPPGFPPFTRGASALGATAHGWEVCQRFDHVDSAVAADHMAEALAGGVGSLWLVADGAARHGLDADDPRADEVGGDGVIVSTASDLGRLLGAVNAGRVPVYLEGGGNGIALAAAYLAAARANGVSLADLKGGFDFDPLGALAGDGELVCGLERSLQLLLELAAWMKSNAPNMRGLCVSTVPYHAAGASAVQELAFSLATGVEYLRALLAGGLGIAEACAQLRLVFAVGRDLFTEVAKLRAARRLWSRAIEACGGGAGSRALPVHAVTSPRCLTTCDPWVNLLRGTVESFAAIVGGADTLTTLPFDAAAGPPDELGRRMAVNTQTILREESHLNRVVDPAGGSWYVERLTDDLAEAAWKLFQRIESEGGMREAFSRDGIGHELSAALDARRRSIAHRRDPVTGVSSYPNLAEETVERASAAVAELRRHAAERLGSHREAHDASAELKRVVEQGNAASGDGAVFEAAIEAAAAGATVAELAEALCAGARPNRIVPLVREREAEMFERLRAASDAWLERHGARPRAFLATMGPIPEHRPRAMFAANLMAAGGIETVDGAAYEDVDAAAEGFAASGAAVAVICAADRRLPDVVPGLAAALKSRGARSVIVAARPGKLEAGWRVAGVDRFIFLGCDVHGVLNDLLSEAGVIR